MTRIGTLSGVGAILAWSTSVPVIRSVTEQLGSTTAGASQMFLAGLIASSYFLFKKKLNKELLKPRYHRFIFVCGSVFALHMLLFYLAVGIGNSREQFLEIGLVYLTWPTIAILLSIFLLNKRTSLWLFPGIAVASAGVYVTVTSGKSLSLSTVTENLINNPIPYILGFFAAFSWSFYSTVTKRLNPPADSSTLVSIFMLLSGLMLFVMRGIFGETSNWNTAVMLEVCYVASISSFGHILWSYSMRHGNVTFVASFSYLLPLFYSLFATFYLETSAGNHIWIGCVLIICGAIACNKAVSDKNGSRLSA